MKKNGITQIEVKFGINEEVYFLGEQRSIETATVARILFDGSVALYYLRFKGGYSPEDRTWIEQELFDSPEAVSENLLSEFKRLHVGVVVKS